jgi:hypothetical protein
MRSPVNAADFYLRREYNRGWRSHNADFRKLVPLFQKKWEMTICPGRDGVHSARYFIRTDLPTAGPLWFRGVRDCYISRFENQALEDTSARLCDSGNTILLGKNLPKV